jgi:hypothetical protein
MLRQNSRVPQSPVLDDNMLREMYVEYNTACDRLVSDPERLLSFTKDYSGRTGQQVEAVQVSQRLLTLRKLGAAKGGLPRLRRNYHGRN